MIKLESDEEILLEARKHWFVYFSEVSVLVALLFLPWVGWNLFSLDQLFVLQGNTYHLFVFLYMTWFVFLWTYLFIIWTNHYLDRWIVTDRRIIDIEQIGLFNREESTFRIENIEDITIEIRGFFATTLDYGTIHIQTAGENRVMSFDNVPSPKKIKGLVTRHHDKLYSKDKP